jgi:ABC-type phosphate transport system substrate-binding protein
MSRTDFPVILLGFTIWGYCCIANTTAQDTKSVDNSGQTPKSEFVSELDALLNAPIPPFGPGFVPEHLRHISQLTSKELESLHRELEAKYQTLSTVDASVPGWDLYLKEKEAIDRALGLAQSRQNNGPPKSTQEVVNRITEIERVVEDLTYVQRESYHRMEREGRRIAKERHGELQDRQGPEVPRLLAQSWSPVDFPRIGGSTSTQPLAMFLTCRAFRLSVEWGEHISRMAARSMYGIGREKQDLVRYSQILLDNDGDLRLAEFSLKAVSPNKLDTRMADFVNEGLVKNESTHLAYRNIVDGKSDLAIIARPPLQKELDYATQKGVGLEIVPCAKDALVFLVNKDNRVETVTEDQIRQIYSGKLQNWKEMSGIEGKIWPYRRPEESGSEPWMKSLVMRGETMSADVSPDLIGSFMSSVFLKVSENKKGIAYSLWYYERYMSGTSKTRNLRINGVEPTYETIRDGSYPFCGDVVVVMRTNAAADSATRRLRDWLLTTEGQRVVQQSGYVPVKDVFNP